MAAIDFLHEKIEETRQLGLIKPNRIYSKKEPKKGRKKQDATPKKRVYSCAWSDHENEILNKNFIHHDKHSVDRIYELLEGKRTKAAIRQRALLLGLYKDKFYGERVAKPWAIEQDEVIHSLGESIPLDELTAEINKVSVVHGLPQRSINAVKQRLNKLGYSCSGSGIGCKYLNVSHIAQVLGCSHTHVGTLISLYGDILKSRMNGRERLIEQTSFARFIVEYPGEVAKLKPDIILLIDVMSCIVKQ